MNAPLHNHVSRRTVLKTGALTVGFALAGPNAFLSAAAQGAAPRVLDPKEVDAFLAVNADGSITMFSGKVDLGQGLRIALPQAAVEVLTPDFRGNADAVRVVVGATDRHASQSNGRPGAMPARSSFRRKKLKPCTRRFAR